MLFVFHYWGAAVYGQTLRVQSALRRTGRRVIFKDKTSILSRCSEHFQSLFSSDRVVQDPAVLCILQQPFKAELEEQLSMKEINKAIEQVRSSQAAGVDGTPPKLWKEGGPELHSKLHELLVSGWEQDQVTSDLCDVIIATLYKNNGEISDYSSYSGIILLSIAGKIFAHVLLKRLVSTVAEDHLPETQCGFRANRGTADIVFVLRQLQEKCKEQNKTVCRVCGPDHIIWHSEQKGIVDDYGLP